MNILLNGYNHQYFIFLKTPLAYPLISQIRDVNSLLVHLKPKRPAANRGTKFRAQAMLYFPVLLIARVSWVVQSIFFVFGDLPGAKIWSTKGIELDRARRKRTLATMLEVCQVKTPSCLQDKHMFFRSRVRNQLS